MMLFRIVAFSVLIVGFSGFGTVLAGLFYVPSSAETSLLQRIELKVQRLNDETLPLVQDKVLTLTDTFLTVPRGLCLLNTVANILRLEIERRSLIASQADIDSDTGQEEDSPKTLAISDEQEQLLKKMEGYRYNKEQ